MKKELWDGLAPMINECPRKTIVSVSDTSGFCHWALFAFVDSIVTSKGTWPIESIKEIRFGDGLWYSDDQDHGLLAPDPQRPSESFAEENCVPPKPFVRLLMIDSIVSSIEDVAVLSIRYANGDEWNWESEGKPYTVSILKGYSE